jgi:hypothetical protein
VAPAVEYTRAITGPRTEDNHHNESNLWMPVLEAVALSIESVPKGGWSVREIPSAAELNKEQRAVIELLAHLPV